MYRLLTWLSLMALLSACQSNQTTQTELPDLILPQSFSSINWQTVDNQTHNDINWWQAFQDPVIDHLIAQLNHSNPSLVASFAQYQAAVAALRGVESAKSPTITLNASASKGTLASNTSFSTGGLPTNSSYSLSTGVNWEMDVWGKIEHNINANQALADASLADLRAMQLSRQATLIDTLFTLRNNQQQQQLVRRSIDAYQRFLQLTQARKRAGVASALDTAQAQTQLHAQQAQLIDLQEQASKLQHALSALVGQTKSALILGENHALPTLPALIPSAWLIQRPDIQASRSRVLANKAQLGLAEVAFFPTITLNASANYRNTELNQLINLPNTIWSLGPNLAATLFDGGKREAGIEQAKANLLQASANYQQTVLTAFQEVEDNLSSMNFVSQELGIQQLALKAAQQAHQIAQSQYRAGINSALNVITAYTAELTAERTFLNLQLRQQQALLILLKNSDGHWQSAATQAINSTPLPSGSRQNKLDRPD